MFFSRRKLISMILPGAVAAGSLPAFAGSSARGASTQSVTFAPRATKVANTLADGGSVVIDCYGDSTMWGSLPGESSKQDIKNSPASLLQALHLIYPNQVKVNNKAIPGTTIRNLISGHDGGPGPYEGRILKSEAVLVYCNHCLNDCNSLQSDEQQYKADLIAFIDITRKYNKIPVLVTPSIISPVIDGKDFMMRRMPAFIQAMRDVAQLMNVDLVDNYHYSYKTSRMIPASMINGDGVHLNTESYQNAGWNMAIPLLISNSLTNPYDIAGLSTSVYRDTVVQSRGVWKKTESRFGSVLTGDSIDTPQTILFPVVLENPTDNTELIIGGFRGEAGGKARFTYFGDKEDARFCGDLDYSMDVGVTYDEVFKPTSCKLAAGLHIIGVEASTSTGGKNFNFSGVQLIPK
ncbi:SGNH/GDSL hydrolase family protein [Enterobacter sp. 18A13]|uniref:SGNH/GDSL hydrolase family protein n=1 Tax=Enterobacter sp. 18A13 TaxID=2565914 RepID=UPI0010CA3024|nr:SGNH/GDSL hydrolase family protein [Enterobacter sp. 18A13]BBJ66343.1 hypothetical protein ECC18A13_009080 [Enterobacter sp. 18A13]